MPCILDESLFLLLKQHDIPFKSDRNITNQITERKTTISYFVNNDVKYKKLVKLVPIHTEFIKKTLKLWLHLFKLVLDFQLQSLEILKKHMILQALSQWMQHTSVVGCVILIYYSILFYWEEDIRNNQISTASHIEKENSLHMEFISSNITLAQCIYNTEVYTTVL